MGDLSKRYGATSETGRKSIFDFGDKTVKWWKQKEGRNRINILPYAISSKHHPLVFKGTLDKGDLDYTLEIFVHNYIGPSNATVVCPNRNYGKPCPICEESDRLKQAGKEKESSALWAKKKMYYNVQDVLKEDEGVQLFETNYKFFEKPLRSLATDTDDGTPFVDFADPKKGRVIAFTGEKETFAGKDFIQFANFKFIDRESSVRGLLDSVLELDKYITVPTYEELEALLHGVEDDEDDAVKGGRAASYSDDDDDDPVPPVKTEKAEAKKPEPEADDDKPVCPHGHVYGKDWEEYPADCPKCKLWKACSKA